MIDISEQDAIRIFKCLSDEHDVKISIHASQFSDSTFSIGLITSKEKFTHMCYANKSGESIWVEISVPIKEWDSFQCQEHVHLLDIALNIALISDVMFYDNTGEHVLIKKGTTFEELLLKADLRT